ncbi:hypothetical protein F4781DRAFT_266692 [Annulohypoxylon bovei var. microspora]|nr:hypothetical protein F4781DRAFT_266692 [Annulohypoxylon bovei var. microspora]
MSLREAVTSAIAPDTAHMRETANAQLGSTFFGRLPLEIRDMIYAECWKASGLKQHVFIHGGRLTHWPCTLASDEVDERLEELHRMFEVQENQQRSRTRSLILDDKWARRFSSPWHNHWRCEEEMDETVVNDEGTHHGHTLRSNRTLFLPILLTCKRTYLEARPSLYASITLTFTDLATAHACLALSPSTVSSQLRSLSFSLALPIKTLHQHKQQLSPTDPPGPWADLCTQLSNLVRFAALRSVALRLALAASDTATNYRDDHEGGSGSANRISAGEPDMLAWWEVRERWALSAVRGLLARRLVLQLPRFEPTHRYPPWEAQYKFLAGDARGVPFRRLDRYAALPPMRLRRDGRVEPRMDGPVSPSFSVASRAGGKGRAAGDGGADGDGNKGETRLQKTRRGVRELVIGLKPS